MKALGLLAYHLVQYRKDRVTKAQELLALEDKTNATEQALIAAMKAQKKVVLFMAENALVLLDNGRETLMLVPACYPHDLVNKPDAPERSIPFANPTTEDQQSQADAAHDTKAEADEKP